MKKALLTLMILAAPIAAMAEGRGGHYGGHYGGGRVEARGYSAGPAYRGGGYYRGGAYFGYGYAAPYAYGPAYSYAPAAPCGYRDRWGYWHPTACYYGPGY